MRRACRSKIRADNSTVVPGADGFNPDWRIFRPENKTFGLLPRTVALNPEHVSLLPHIGRPSVRLRTALRHLQPSSGIFRPAPKFRVNRHFGLAGMKRSMRTGIRGMPDSLGKVLNGREIIRPTKNPCQLHFGNSDRIKNASGLRKIIPVGPPVGKILMEQVRP